MPKIKVQVDSAKLQSEIEAAEKKNRGPFRSLRELFDAVAKGSYCKSNRITSSVVTMRYKEFGLKSQTKAGKPGRSSAPKEPELKETEPTPPVRPTPTVLPTPSIQPASPALSPNGEIKKYRLDGKRVTWIELIYIAHKEGYGLNGENPISTNDAANFLRLREHTVSL